MTIGTEDKWIYVIIALLITFIQLRISCADPPEQDVQYFNFNPPAGTYNYGYIINETGQFHFERRGPDNVTYGCYGYTADSGHPQITYYVADANGYRVIPAHQPLQVFWNDHQTLRTELRQWDGLYIPEECSQVIHYRPMATTAPEPTTTSSPPHILGDPFPEQSNSPQQSDLTTRVRATEDVCYQILQIPNEYRQLTDSFQYPDVHHIKCLLRCMGIIARCYSDERGMDLDRIYQKFYLEAGSSLTKEQFESEARSCIEANTNSETPMDACEKVYQTYGCFKDQFMNLLGNPSYRN